MGAVSSLFAFVEDIVGTVFYLLKKEGRSWEWRLKDWKVSVKGALENVVREVRFGQKEKLKIITWCPGVLVPTRKRKTLAFAHCCYGSLLAPFRHRPVSVPSSAPSSRSTRFQLSTAPCCSHHHEGIYRYAMHAAIGALKTTYGATALTALAALAFLEALPNKV